MSWTFPLDTLTSGVKEASWEVISIPSVPLSSHAALGCGFSNPVVPMPARSPQPAAHWGLLEPLSPAILTVFTHLLPEQWLLYWKILESDADSLIRVSLAQSISGPIYNSLIIDHRKICLNISLHSAGPNWTSLPYQAMGTTRGLAVGGGITGEQNLQSDSQWSVTGLAEYIMSYLAKCLGGP